MAGCYLMQDRKRDREARLFPCLALPMAIAGTIHVKHASLFIFPKLFLCFCAVGGHVFILPARCILSFFILVHYF